jgi:uncharacterized protein YigE (DUF2233 family)
MSKVNKRLFFFGLTFLFFFFGAAPRQEKDVRFLSFVAEPSSVKFYWKDDTGQIFRSIQNLKSFIETKNLELKFAMNGGMYMKDNSPQGLYIENNVTLIPLDTLSGTGNFYLKPNGVFYLTKDNRAVVCETDKFTDNGQINFATQSGPMLLIDGEIHPAFKKGSKNLNIRNGVGILPDNKVVFAVSKEEVNFYDFAEYFKNMNCKNALYLDGFVSRAYLPEQNWKQLDGNFGVIIGVAK